MLRLPMAVCTLASAGRRLSMANAPGAGAGAAPAAGAAVWAAAEPVKEPLHRSRVSTANLAQRGRVDIRSPDDNGETTVATCGAFDVFGMLQQNKGCSTLCGPVAQLGARFHGMEEVIGSIPIRSTKITSAESKSYSRLSLLRETRTRAQKR